MYANYGQSVQSSHMLTQLTMWVDIGSFPYGGYPVYMYAHCEEGTGLCFKAIYVKGLQIISGAPTNPPNPMWVNICT